MRTKIAFPQPVGSVSGGEILPHDELLAKINHFVIMHLQAKAPSVGQRDPQNRAATHNSSAGYPIQPTYEHFFLGEALPRLVWLRVEMPGISLSRTPSEL